MLKREKGDVTGTEYRHTADGNLNLPSRDIDSLKDRFVLARVSAPLRLADHRRRARQPKAFSYQLSAFSFLRNPVNIRLSSITRVFKPE